jgi:hypothetical protein
LGPHGFISKVVKQYFFEISATSFIPESAWLVDLFTRFPSLVHDTKESRFLAIRSVFTLGGLFDDVERATFMPSTVGFGAHSLDISRRFDSAAVDSKLDELDLKVTPADLETLLKVR